MYTIYKRFPDQTVVLLNQTRWWEFRNNGASTCFKELFIVHWKHFVNHLQLLLNHSCEWFRVTQWLVLAIQNHQNRNKATGALHVNRLQMIKCIIIHQIHINYQRTSKVWRRYWNILALLESYWRGREGERPIMKEKLIEINIYSNVEGNMEKKYASKICQIMTRYTRLRLHNWIDSFQRLWWNPD